ncbi:MAG: superoxide dismutase family protein [Brevinemataceae bacterium]
MYKKSLIYVAIVLVVLFVGIKGFLSKSKKQANHEYISTVIYELNDSESGTGNEVGTVSIHDLDGKGVVIKVDSENMVPGEHGFHLHETNVLTPMSKDDGTIVLGGMSGGHWDPDNTGKHLGPNGNGHRGDLPFIIIDKDGKVNAEITNTRLLLNDFKGRALMIHVNTDNYTDTPPLGGSGSRMYAAPFSK